jgi:hypothetical protein
VGVQAVPSQCSNRLPPIPLTVALPRTQISFAEMAVMADSWAESPGLLKGGLGNTLHCVPSQCSITG